MTEDKTNNCDLETEDMKLPEAANPTDGRVKFDWMTHYPANAKKEIYCELCYLFIIFFASLFFLFATWNGWISSTLSLSSNEAYILKKYSYYAFSGMLGGIIFGMKYFYRVVARGWWHQDRRAWRITSPFISMTIAFIIGMMFNTNIETAKQPTNTPSIILFGFLAGYFADEAVGKMYEIANVIFGRRTSLPKTGDKN